VNLAGGKLDEFVHAFRGTVRRPPSCNKLWGRPQPPGEVRALLGALARATIQPADQESHGHPEGRAARQVMIGMINSATMFATLIIGLMAGPAVSLYGSPTVSPVTAAACASDPFPP
jgi:hypothetical protein